MLNAKPTRRSRRTFLGLGAAGLLALPVAAAGLVDPVAQKIAAELIPTVERLGDRLVWDYTTPAENQEFLAKVDHNVSAAQRVNFSYFGTRGDTVVVPGGVSAADPSATCQHAIARATAKFTRTALKIGQRCALRTGLGAGCVSADAAGNGAYTRASGRLAARVGDDCAGADLSAFAPRCPDASGPPLSAAELVECLRDTHLDRIAALLAVEFPAAPARAAQAGGECTAPETCQCHCASPSGAFLGPIGADVL